MARIKLHMPETYLFSTNIDVRITDLNYGNHLANDSLLSIIHEARVRFLNHFGYTELDIEGIGLVEIFQTNLDLLQIAAKVQWVFPPRLEGKIAILYGLLGNHHQKTFQQIFQRFQAR